MTPHDRPTGLSHGVMPPPTLGRILEEEWQWTIAAYLLLDKYHSTVW